jgi:hypothetical protein
MGIQLHVNGTKRRVIELLYQIGITVGYKLVLTVFRELSASQRASLRIIRQTNDFLVTWDNFEQMRQVKHQRLDNKSEFFSVTTAQILKSTWMPEEGLKQFMSINSLN